MALLAVGMVAIVPSDSAALPPGKSWTSVQQLVVPGYTYLPNPRLETDINGLPLIFVSARNGSIEDGVGLRWADSTWQGTVQTDLAIGTLQPVVSPLGTFYLVWAGSEAGSAGLLQMAEFRSEGLGAHDTVTQVLEYTSLYTAAVAPGGRRWVGVNDNFRPRLLYSDTLRIWHEVPLPFPDGGALAITPLSDTTALVIIGVQGFMRWGVADGQTWQEVAQLTQYGGDISTFRIRSRLPDSHLLVWDSYGPTVSVASFHDGSWSAAETLTCAYEDPRVAYTFWPYMSRDAGNYPVVTWQAYNGWIGGDVICAFLPTDSGFTTADQVWSATYANHPVAARDRNGDAWIAWWSYQGGTFWTHTYTSAESSLPTITAAGGTVVVNWALSQAAPETWWGILRSTDSGPYELIARVRAGNKQSLAWTDSSPPSGLLRYRIRGESVDSRFRRESGDAAITVGVGPGAGLGPLSVSRASPNPTVLGSSVRFVVSNAAHGTIHARLFDLNGREVHQQDLNTSGSATDTVDVLLLSDGRKMAPGLYFLSFKDESGRSPITIKLAILQ